MAFARVVSPVLVGRDAELSTLEDAFLSALRGDGGVVILGGEAGMGKTRLVAALATRAQRLGCAVLAGGCSQAELSLPYLPFLEAIGNYLATADISELHQRLGSATEELAQLFPQLGKAAQPGQDAGQAKLRLFESMLLLLRGAARTRAALLVLEDLQWADPATRELLDYATRRLRNTSVLVVATYRSDELHRKHALLPTIQGWRRSGQIEMVELEALDPPQVAEMVCAIFDEPSISDEFRDLIHERSEGNPFVVEEMLRDALDRGDIFRTDTGWDRKSIVEMRMPRTVRDTILQRIERLPGEQVNVLSAASAIGRSFDIKTLSAVAGADETLVLAAIEASLTAQLLDEEDRTSGNYRFRHALTQEAVYEDMVVPRRQQLHGRIADVLRATPGSAQVVIAHHLLMAGRHDEAVAVCVSAADEARHTLAFHDAAALLERAAPHVQDSVERARLMCQAGVDYWNNSEPGAARGLLEEGVKALEAAGLGIEAANNRLALGRCYWELLRSDKAQQEFDKARSVLEPHGPSEALAIAYIRLSGLISFNEASLQSLEYAQRAAEIANQAGATMALAWSWNFLALAEVHLGRVADGFAHLEDSYRASMEGGFQFQASNAIFNAAYEAIHLGLGERLRVRQERANAPMWSSQIVWVAYIKSLALLHQGHVREAIDLAMAGSQRAREVGQQKQAWRSALMLAFAYAENMQGQLAAEILPALSTRVEGQDTVYDAAPRIRTKLALGDDEAALEMAKTVSPAVSDLGSPADVVAEAAREDPAWLSSFLEALPAQGECAMSPRLAAARGRLALYEGRIDDALRELNSSVEAFERSGFRLDVWHIARSLAEAEARAGDPDAARRRLKVIVEEATASGGHLAAHLAFETAERLGLDVGQAPARPEPPAAQIATGERLVSVLFADVRGYSTLTGQTAPAELSDRIATLQRWAAQEVVRRHGLVDKFAGDAIMATFNISGQTVDHTREALRAAMGIIDKAALAGIPVGAGIAVGPAVVGSLTKSANVSVLGEVTNLAARLQAQSSPGEVTLSEEAYRRVKDWLDAQGMRAERGELNLKGFLDPVTAYQVATLAVATQPA